MGIETLEPTPVWRLFGGIAAVPRPSRHEQRIRQHLVAVAERLGFAARSDEAGNLLIDVPASPGRAQAPITVLQGHLDMVCEKDRAAAHDFSRDPIRPLLATDPQSGQQIVRAAGTTLGADNGIGLALALAAASQPEVRHGPLEILCTVNEECGMSGAKALGRGFFRGRRLLNLDSEEDDVLYIGCAGGCDVTLAWEFSSAAPRPGLEARRVSVSGLRGGHSGGDIHRNRANANRLLVAVLRQARSARLQLLEVAGGRLRNAIPREAHAVVLGSRPAIKALHQAAESARAAALRANGEQNCTIQLEPLPGGELPAALAPVDTRRLLAAVAALPDGVQAVVPEIPGLVRTSNNVATIATEPGAAAGLTRVTVGCLSRSSSRDELHELVRRIEAVGQLAGAATSVANEYPGWQPNVDSPLLAICRRVYAELFGAPPVVTAIHAGLECGIIGERMGGQLEMVSFGPRIVGAHSPDEHVYVSSVQKSWRFLTALLDELSRA